MTTHTTTPKESPMTTINPKDCKPDEAYRVRVFAGREVTAMRGDTGVCDPWIVTSADGLGHVWARDEDVTVLHRLVPEPEEKVLDVLMYPWETLSAAEALVFDLACRGPDERVARRVLVNLARRLEAEHQAAQEKAAADAAREAAIEKAAQVMVPYPNGASLSLGSDAARALADAGLLAEAVQP